MTIQEISERFEISRSHLMKVVNQLIRNGFVEGLRGKGGGLRLARPPQQIVVGDVVRKMETDLALVECFHETSHCLLTASCQLKGVLGAALEAFFASLDKVALSDVGALPAGTAACAEADALRGSGGPLRPTGGCRVCGCRCRPWRRGRRCRGHGRWRRPGHRRHRTMAHLRGTAGALHHVADLLSSSLAVADNGLLDLQGGVFGHRQVAGHGTADGRAPGLAEQQGGLRIDR